MTPGAGAFQCFRARVLADRALQDALRVPTDLQAFAAECVRLGADLGFVFSTDDVAAACTEGRRALRATRRF
ncbi:MAG: hypothetical protein U1F10_12620 [Burkholderiales bacterium]